MKLSRKDYTIYISSEFLRIGTKDVRLMNVLPLLDIVYFLGLKILNVSCTTTYCIFTFLEILIVFNSLDNTNLYTFLKWYIYIEFSVFNHLTERIRIL